MECATVTVDEYNALLAVLSGAEALTLADGMTIGAAGIGLLALAWIFKMARKSMGF